MVLFGVIQRCVDQSIDRQVDKQQRRVQKRAYQGGWLSKIRPKEEEGKQHADNNQVDHQHDHAGQRGFEVKIRPYALIRFDEVQHDAEDGRRQKHRARYDIE